MNAFRFWLSQLCGKAGLTTIIVTVLVGSAAGASEPRLGQQKKLNNLVAQLLEVSAPSKSQTSFRFERSTDGWIFLSVTPKGNGSLSLTLDPGTSGEAALVSQAVPTQASEAMHYVKQGEHSLRVEYQGKARIAKLVVRAIPELIHCGLGFDPQIKSYGLYDLNFLKGDVLPNITTFIVPANIQLAPSVIEDWHRAGKKFVAETGVNAQGKTVEDHYKYWTSFFEKAGFLDGIIIDEFIVNKPSTRSGQSLSPERQKRLDEERQRHEIYAKAIEQIHADPRYQDKRVYAYIGGSGKTLNQEIIGTNLIRTIINCAYRVALERYLHEMSSEKGSQEALETFVNGIADWEAKEPGVKNHMVIAFGLFSMPPGGLNKQPNVDYHVWMDQQMNVVANHPVMSGLAGLEWWTSVLADEETVRFVGKLYRHYAIEGKTNRLTTDPLFLTHIDNADFEKGTEAWELQPAEEGSIQVKKFPRYGRIEGRFMGLGRPADPEHIGDTFLWMKRSEKGPNRFAQTIKGLEPGRLYSMKMFNSDYQDLVNPKAKKVEEATRFLGTVTLEGVEIDRKRSFKEMYASNPEPRIPVWITYHWTVFRAKSATARLTVSDWPEEPVGSFGQEQTFNFIEIEPYHE